MPAALIPREEVLNRIFTVFRSYGYEGATLARVAEATGLGRASLYHYFPQGKDQMGREVMELARRWLDEQITAPLNGKGDVAARIKTMIKNLRAGYADGENSCVINLLSIGEAEPLFRSEVRRATELWLTALERVLREAGQTQAQARNTAVDAVIRVEGALIVTRATGDTAVFTRTLKDLERSLIAATAK